MQDDATRWNDRYRSSPPAAPLRPEVFDDHPELLHLVPDSGIAIDSACGLGRQVLWLADRGLRVVALDVSPVAIDVKATARCSPCQASIIASRARLLTT